MKMMTMSKMIVEESRDHDQIINPNNSTSSIGCYDLQSFGMDVITTK